MGVDEKPGEQFETPIGIQPRTNPASIDCDQLASNYMLVYRALFSTKVAYLNFVDITPRSHRGRSAKLK